jgi:hypothetical protein
MSFLTGMVRHLARPPGGTLDVATAPSEFGHEHRSMSGIPELGFVARRIYFEEKCSMTSLQSAVIAELVRTAIGSLRRVKTAKSCPNS